MTQVIEKARKRLTELEAEIENIRAFIHMYQKLAEDEEATQVATSSDSPVPSPPLRIRIVEKSSPAQIVAAAKELMTEKQRPLNRGELVRLLTLRGLRIAGGDKSKNVGTIIWRSKEFENVEGKGYWPLDKGPWSNSEFNF